MEQAHQPAGPEAAWYQARLRKERRTQRITGSIIFCLGISLLIFETIFVPTHNLVVDWPVVLITLLPLLQGLSLLLASRKQVDARAIEQLRRSERIQLFRQAQGVSMPWQYRRWVRVLEASLGLFFLVVVVLQSLFNAQPRGRQAAWGVILVFLLLGVLLLVDSLYLKPWRARRLAKRSSAELSYRLAMGELLTYDSSEK